MIHHYRNLLLQKEELDNVYQIIYDWINIPVSKKDDAFYLIIYAQVSWSDEPIYSILMQRSKDIGQKVDITEPVHIPESDIEIVTTAWNNFIKVRKGKK